jgi:hypothetical protein
MNHVVKNVLFFHSGLLQKRIVVCPTNLQNNHWGATYIFNAGDITAAIDDASLGLCRTCFSLLLQSSSLWHNKDTKKDSNHLIPLPCVQLEEQNAIASHVSIPNQMKWHSPFGRTFLGI